MSKKKVNKKGLTKLGSIFKRVDMFGTSVGFKVNEGDVF